MKETNGELAPFSMPKGSDTIKRVKTLKEEKMKRQLKSGFCYITNKGKVTALNSMP